MTLTALVQQKTSTMNWHEIVTGYNYQKADSKT